MYDVIEQNFDVSVASKMLDRDQLDPLEHELRLLSAAELATAFRAINRPLEVNEFDVEWVRRYHYCTLGQLPNCKSKKNLWDITVFSGHMKKLDLLGYADLGTLHNNFEQAYLALRSNLSGSEVGKQLVDDGRLALQAVTWLAKLDLLFDQEDEARIEKFAKLYLSKSPAEALVRKVTQDPKKRRG